MSKHTQTPWHTRGGAIDGANHANVFTSTALSQVSKADSEHIVLCVNAYEPMRTALEVLLADAELGIKPYQSEINQARAALAAATPAQPEEVTHVP